MYKLLSSALIITLSLVGCGGSSSGNTNTSNITDGPDIPNTSDTSESSSSDIIDTNNNLYTISGTWEHIVPATGCKETFTFLTQSNDPFGGKVYYTSLDRNMEGFYGHNKDGRDEFEGLYYIQITLLDSNGLSDCSGESSFANLNLFTGYAYKNNNTTMLWYLTAQDFLDSSPIYVLTKQQ